MPPPSSHFFCATSFTLAVMVNARESSSRLLGSPRCSERSSQSCSCRRMKDRAPSPNEARMPRARQAWGREGSVGVLAPSAG